jgi:hypothetical protein
MFVTTTAELFKRSPKHCLVMHFKKSRLFQPLVANFVQPPLVEQNSWRSSSGSDDPFYPNRLHKQMSVITGFSTARFHLAGVRWHVGNLPPAEAGASGRTQTPEFLVVGARNWLAFSTRLLAVSEPFPDQKFLSFASCSTVFPILCGSLSPMSIETT